MFIVILAQSAATSRAYADQVRRQLRRERRPRRPGPRQPRRRLSGTFVVNGSPTKTEMVDSAGGRSQLSQLTAGPIVVVVLLFLTAPLSYMPNAVLAVGRVPHRPELVDITGMRKIARLRRDEFVVAAIDRGRRRDRRRRAGDHPGDAALDHRARRPLVPSARPAAVPDEAGHIASDADTAGTQAAPGLAIYRFGSGIYYANASRLTEEILDLVDVASPRLRWLAVSMVSVGDIDFSGSDTVDKLVAELQRTASRSSCATWTTTSWNSSRPMTWSTSWVRATSSLRRWKPWRPWPVPAGEGGTDASAQAAVVEDPAPGQDADGDQHPEGG